MRPGHVQSVTLEVAREVAGAVPGAVLAVEPACALSHLRRLQYQFNFTVFLHVQDFVCGLEVKHEFLKRLHARYRRERIEMPFPTRTAELAPETLAGLGLLIRKEAATR
jgi:small-conductance mechanosensitive channel